MKKVLFTLLAWMALVSQASAEAQIVSMNYNLAASAYTYCRVLPARQIRQGSLADVSASTTVTGSDSPFLGMAVGDVLTFTSQDTVQVRTIATFTNANSIVVNSAITITGAQTTLLWGDFTCGTASDDGWFDADCPGGITIQVQIDTINATSIDLQVEGKLPYPGAEAMKLINNSWTATTNEPLVVTEPGLSQFRVGQQVTGDAGAQDVTLAVSCVKGPF